MADDAAAPEGELTASSADSAAKPKEGDAASNAAEPESTAAELTDGETSETTDPGDADDAGGGVDADAEPAAERSPMSHVKVALIAGLVAVVALTGLIGWLGFRAYQANQDEQLRSLYLQVGRQGALNLTTIDFESADADVQRILDSATGTFYDDFQQRAEPFVEVVKQAQSTSEGTIAEAGLESVDGDEAQVLVAVTVRTSNVGAPEQPPRAWRMRISVQKVGDDEVKVSNVEFVP